MTDDELVLYDGTLGAVESDEADVEFEVHVPAEATVDSVLLNACEYVGPPLHKIGTDETAGAADE